MKVKPQFTQPKLIIVSHTQVFISIDISFINNINRKHQIIYIYISYQERELHMQR